MPSGKSKLTHAAVLALTSGLSDRIRGQYPTTKTVAVYGIPRGGVPVGYALVATDPKFFQLVESPDEAMVLVDDVVDSGATKTEFGLAFPDIPFFALVDKQSEACPFRGQWVVFPWEKEEASKDDTIVGTLTNRMQRLGRPFFANDAILDAMRPGDLALLEKEVENRFDHLLRGLVIDVDHDHNTKSSARRLAKMYVREVFRGRYTPPPTLVDFPNVKQVDEMFVTGPITLRSACSHHFVPITGKCWIGVVPGDRLVGLSKFNRIVEWIAARPQIQEELVVQIADYIEAQLKPKGLAVVVDATHMCMTWRGVREPDTARMTSSVMRGVFRSKPEARSEFLALVK